MKYPKKIDKTTQLFWRQGITASLVFSLAACGGGNNSDPVKSTPSTPSPTITGKVIDGYIRGAIVFWDCNQNNQPDTDEISTTTTEGGKYEISDKSKDGCQLLAQVLPSSVDEDQPYKIGQSYFMKAAPNRPELITPYSTLIAGKVDSVSGLTVEQAENDLAAIMGMDSKLLVDYKDSKSTVNSVALGAAAIVIADSLQKNQTKSPYFTDGAINAYNEVQKAFSLPGFNEAIQLTLKPFVEAYETLPSKLSKIITGDPNNRLKRLASFSDSQSNANLDSIVKKANERKAIMYGVVDWNLFTNDELKLYLQQINKMNGLSSNRPEQARINALQKIRNDRFAAASLTYSTTIEDESSALTFFTNDPSASVDFFIEIGADTTSALVDAVIIGTARPKVGRPSNYSKSVERFKTVTEVLKHGFETAGCFKAAADIDDATESEIPNAIVQLVTKCGSVVIDVQKDTVKLLKNGGKITDTGKAILVAAGGFSEAASEKEMSLAQLKLNLTFLNLIHDLADAFVKDPVTQKLIAALDMEIQWINAYVAGQELEIAATKVQDEKFNHAHSQYDIEVKKAWRSYLINFMEIYESNYFEVVTTPDITATPSTSIIGQAVNFVVSQFNGAVKVVWDFGGEIGNVFNEVINGVSDTVSAAFKTAGTKTVTATFLDSASKPLEQASTTITVKAAALPKADITSSNSNSATQPGSIVNNATTDDTTPTLSGTISAALSSGQKVNVYDGSSEIPFEPPAVDNGTNWTFTPARPLPTGLHSFTVAVAGFDGTTGPRSTPFVINVQSTKASITTITPSSVPMTVGDNTTFTVTGQNLPLKGFAVSIQGSTCQSPQYPSINKFIVTCALGNSGNKTFALLTSGGVVIDDSQSITILSIYPGVTTVSPSTATAGVPTTFTVTGQYLPTTAVMSIADGTCQSPIPASRTSNGFTVVCTPGGGAGYKVVTIKSDTLAHGGTVIDVSKTVNVTTSNVQPVTGTFTVVANSYAGTAFTVPAGNNSCAFTAAGTWSFGAGSYDANGYTGTPVPAWADTRMTSVPIGRLVASTPDGFKSIGTASTQAFPAGSVLTFVMNDASNVNLNGYSDNGGSLTVAYSCSAATSSQVYSAANDFSSTNNPNGAWSYGWAASLGQPFQFQNMQKLSSLALDIWSAPNSYPYVLHNGTANQITTHNAIYVPNALGLHPGDQGEVAIVRWTAPTAGTYAVNAKFGGAEAGMANVVVQKNGVTLFQDVKNTSDPQLLAPKTYIGQVSVAAGDTLDFVVGNGGNGYISDSTRLEATLVPCPGGVCPSTLTNSFSDTFDGTSLNTSSWNVVNGTGGHTVSAGEVQLGAGSYAHTVGKKTFSGSKIVIEARFAGKKPSGRDTGIVLVDSSTGDYIRVGDTSYFGWGLFVHGTGALNLTGANNSRGAPTSGINLETNGVSVSTYKVVRVTIEGSTVTVERGDSLNALTEQLQRTLGSSIVGRTFDLRIQTGANDGVYSPGWFDWITVSAQ